MPKCIMLTDDDSSYCSSTKRIIVISGCAYLLRLAFSHIPCLICITHARARTHTHSLSQLMESWRYHPEENGILFSDEVDLEAQEVAASRRTLMGWDKVSLDCMEFVDLGSAEMAKKSFGFNSSGLAVLGDDEIGMISGEVGMTSPTCMITTNSSLESGSNHSTSLLESNSQDSSLIDLKLGRLVDSMDAQNGKDSKAGLTAPAVIPTDQSKRARLMSSKTAVCRVYGCNKDLTCSKDYHKRHRVCEVHTKTPEVIVNGIKQRFCQQCSRFHLLVEFDNSKRSCRRRLAGHNERRRKPQLNKTYKFLQTYQETKTLRNNLQKGTPFLFPDIIPGGVLYPESHEQVNWCGQLKMEGRSSYNPQSAIPITNGKGMQFTHGIPAENDYIFNSASTIHEPAVVLHSGRALSLLSAQSQDFGLSARYMRPVPLTIEAGHTHNSSQHYELCSLEKLVRNGFHSFGRNPIGVNGTGPFMVSDATQGEWHGFFEQSGQMNATKCSISPRQGSTVALLQLPSHLHRVEQQRNQIHVKHENEAFSNFISSNGF